MKTMNCKQLGGACNREFHANTFEEIAELSKVHGMEMFSKQDKAHLEAMNRMQELMKEPEAMKAWLESKKRSSRQYLKIEQPERFHTAGQLAAARRVGRR